MKIEVKIYDRSKYEADSKVVAKVVYDNVEYIEVQKINDETIYKMGFDEVDENGEYCIVKFTYEEEISTFRNSYCDIFKY